jgi:hypothetical protein
MPRLPISRLGALLAAMLTLHGCSSVKSVPVECPRFRPSAEALQPIPQVPWRDLATSLPR